jgi:hypothetical protein
MTQKSKLRAKLQRLDHLPGTLGTNIFFTSKFLPKSKIQNKKFKNEVIFKVSITRSEGKKIVKIAMFIYLVQFVATNIEGWLNKLYFIADL